MRSVTKKLKTISFEFTIPEVTMDTEIEVDEDMSHDDCLEAMHESAMNVASMYEECFEPEFFNIKIENVPVDENLQK